MSRQHINLDQIERRLGHHGTGGYAAFDTPFSVSASEGSHDSSILNSGFIATVFATFLLVGSGSFFFMGEQLLVLEQFQSDPGIASSADPLCAALWRKAGNNSSAMSCYLTVMPERLCDVSERKKLRVLFASYRTEMAALTAKETERIEKLRVKSVEKSLDNSSGMFGMLGGDGAGGGKKSLKSAAKNMKRMKKSLKKKGAAAKQFYEETVANQERLNAERAKLESAMVEQTKKLVESGYLQSGDVGWFTDAILQKGYEVATYSPERPCK